MSDQQWIAPGSPAPDRGVAGPPPTPSFPPAGPGPGPAAYPMGSSPPAPPGPVAMPVPPQRYGMEFRPGVIPLRPLTLGDLYGAAFKTIRGNVAATVGMATLVSLLFMLPFTALGTFLARSFNPSLVADSADPTVAFEGFDTGILGVYLPIIGSVFATILMAGVMAWVLGQAVLGRKVSLAQTWAGTRGRLLALFGTVGLTALAGIGVAVVVVGMPIGLMLVGNATSNDVVTAVGVILLILGLILAFVVMMLLGVRWGFGTSIVVLESAGPVTALRRSWRLVGSPLKVPFWRIFGIRLLAGLIASTAAQIITLPLVFVMMIVMGVLIGDDPNNLSNFGTVMALVTAISGLASIITSALTTPFTSGVDALLYVDTRIRSEGLDIQLLQAAQGVAPAPWPTP